MDRHWALTRILPQILSRYCASLQTSVLTTIRMSGQHSSKQLITYHDIWFLEAMTDLFFRMRYIGHRALQAQVTSTSMHASDYKVQFEIILPAIFETLITSERMTEDVYRK